KQIVDVDPIGHQATPLRHETIAIDGRHTIALGQGNYEQVMSYGEDIRKQNRTGTGLACEGGKGCFDLVIIVNQRHDALHFEGRGGGIHWTQEERSAACGRLRVEQEADPRNIRGDVFEQLYPFSGHRGVEIRKSRDVSTRLGEARDETLANGVGDRHEYDW